MRVVFLWTTLSGYMAACWRELAKRPELDLLVIAYRSSAKSNTSFDDSLLAGIPHQLLDEDQRMDGRGLIGRVVAHRPDVIVATGWWQKHFREVALAPELMDAAFIMGLDTPWRTPLQYLNRLRFPRYLHRLDGVAPAGERAWQHARNLGIAPDRIFRGQYGVNVSAFRPTFAARLAGPWPRRFLFAGRYVDEKAVDVLVEAYRLYRTRVTNPWELRCCGRGPLGPLLATVPGIVDAGFVQPDDMPRHWAEAGAFLIPSRFDPWPLALVEACAAGLPVIASEVCGSAVELLRPRYNGLLVPEENAEALAAAMVTLHENEACLPDWGRRSQTLAEPYSAEVWTERWVAILRQTIAARRERRGMTNAECRMPNAECGTADAGGRMTNLEKHGAGNRKLEAAENTKPDVSDASGLKSQVSGLSGAPLRVLLVTLVYEPARQFGGLVSWAVSHAEGLAAQGHEVTVLTSNWGCPFEQTTAATKPKDGGRRTEGGSLKSDDGSWRTEGGGRSVANDECRMTNAEGLRSDASNPSGLSSQELGLPTTGSVRVIRFAATAEKGGRSVAMEQAVASYAGAHDVVHVSGFWQWGVTACVQAARTAGKPCVLSPHGGLAPWVWRRGWSRKMGFYLARGRSSLIAATGLHFVTQSEAQAARGHQAHTPAVVASPGVDTGFWSADDAARDAERMRMGLPEHEHLLLWVGRIHPVKGLDLLAASLASLADFRWRLVLAGSEEDAAEAARLREIFKERGLEARVDFMPEQGREDLRALYRAADLLLLPSRYESCGIVALEAAACGCPCLAADTAGIARELASGGAGWAEPREPARWSARLRELLSENGELERAGAAGPAWIAAGFSKTAAAAKVARFYNQLLQSSKRSLAGEIT